MGFFLMTFCILSRCSKKVKTMTKNAFLLLVSTTILLSCNKDDNNNTNQDFQDFQSQQCVTAIGLTGLYWDYANGLPVPLTEIPTIKNPGTYFIHSDYPQLGFQMPQGYSAFEVSSNNPSSVGVNVIRNDNQVVWRYVPLTSLPGQVAINDAIAFEVNNMFAFYNFNDNFNVICTATRTTNFDGLQITFGARLIQFGVFTGLVWVNTLFEPVSGFTQMASSVSVAPTAEFNKEVFDTFLPISFQLLVIDDGVRDSDLDGYPDEIDAEPFNPNVH